MSVIARWCFRHRFLVIATWVIVLIGLELIVHVNPEAVKRGINPFAHGSAVRNHDAGRDRRAPAGIGQGARRRSDQFPDQRRTGNV